MHFPDRFSLLSSRLRLTSTRKWRNEWKRAFSLMLNRNSSTQNEPHKLKIKVRKGWKSNVEMMVAFREASKWKTWRLLSLIFFKVLHHSSRKSLPFIQVKTFITGFYDILSSHSGNSQQRVYEWMQEIYYNAPMLQPVNGFDTKRATRQPVTSTFKDSSFAFSHSLKSCKAINIHIAILYTQRCWRLSRVTPTVNPIYF